MATDRVPAGKRDCISLRENRRVTENIHDGIDVVGKENDTLPALRKTERSKTKG